MWSYFHFVQRSCSSALQKSLRRVRALPQAKWLWWKLSSSSSAIQSPHPLLVAISVWMRWVISNSSAGFAILMSLVPRTAIAFSRLSPMMTPTPRAALAWLWSIEAMKTRFSPASPIAATWTFWSFNSLLSRSPVSVVPLPLKCVASRISTLSLLM